MEERKDEDVCVSTPPKPTVVVSEQVAHASETPVESMACEGQSQIEGCFSEGVLAEEGEACNGDDVMVEVVGTDVFVDGVCTRNSDDLGSRRDEVPDSEALADIGTETRVGESSVEKFLGVREKGMEGVEAVESEETGREIVAGGGKDDIDSQEVGITNDEAQNDGIGAVIEESLVEAGTSGGETQVLIVEVTNDEGLEGGLVKEAVERDGEMVVSVDGKSEVASMEQTAGMESKDIMEGDMGMEGSQLATELDDGGQNSLHDPETQNIHVSDDELKDSGGSEVVEELSAQTQVEVKAAEEGLSSKDEACGSDIVENNISNEKRDQILVVESGSGSVQNDSVNANPELVDEQAQITVNPESVDEQAQIAVGREAAEEVPSFDDVKTDAVDGNFCQPVEVDSPKLETSAGTSETQQNMQEDTISLCQTAQEDVGDAEASIDEKEHPYSKKEQQLNQEEYLDQSVALGCVQLNSNIEQRMDVDKECTDSEQFGEGQKIEVQLQQVKVETDSGSTQGKTHVCMKMTNSHETSQVIVGGEVAAVIEVAVIDAQVTEGAGKIALVQNQEGLDANVDDSRAAEEDHEMKLENFLEKADVCDFAHIDSDIMEVKEQVIPAVQVSSQVDQEIEAQEQVVTSSTENQSNICTDPNSTAQPTLCGSIQDRKVTGGEESTLSVNEEILDSNIKVVGSTEADQFLESQECLDKSTAPDVSVTDSKTEQVMQVDEQFVHAEADDVHGGQGMEIDDQVIDADHIDVDHIDVHEGQGMEVDEQDSDVEQPNTDEENLSKRTAPRPGISSDTPQAVYQLLSEDEGVFSVSDLVWGKVRSHPWWPGQIFEPSDASEKAMKYHKKDCFLVAYFGDRTFAWNEASLLKPFQTHFSQIEKQSNSDSFHNAVDCALQEVSRRVELGLACSCMPSDAYDKIRFQIVENAGIRQESSMRDGVDKSADANSFHPDKLVDYLKELGESASNGGDRLDLVVAKAQLLAFYRSKGYTQLPEFQSCEVLSDNDANNSHLEDTMQSAEEIEYATFVDRDNEPNSSSKEVSGTRKGSYHKRKHNLKDALYPSKRERSMSELMGGTFDSQDGESESDEKAKLASPTSGKKRRAVDSFSDDSVVQEGRKTISLAKVSITTPLPKPSFKIGECIRRVASQMTGSPSMLKYSGDKTSGDGSDALLENSEDAQRKKLIFPPEYASLDDLLSQLHLAARDPLKGFSFLNIIISFFSDFRNSIIVDRYSVDKAGGKRKKLGNSVMGTPETFEFEDMSDTYWTDRIIQNGSEEQAMDKSSGGGYKIVPVVLDKPLQKSRRQYTRKRYSDGNYDLAAAKPPGYVDEKSPAELILNFPEVDCLPSETNLNKMFRRFGPLREYETEVDMETSRARVVFKRCSDAEVAYNSAGKFNIFGPVLVNYQLSYSISVPFKVFPITTGLGEEDAT